MVVVREQVEGMGSRTGQVLRWRVRSRKKKAAQPDADSAQMVMQLQCI